MGDYPTPADQQSISSRSLAENLAFALEPNARLHAAQSLATEIAAARAKVAELLAERAQLMHRMAAHDVPTAEIAEAFGVSRQLVADTIGPRPRPATYRRRLTR
jgi:hypothetical protein